MTRHAGFELRTPCGPRRLLGMTGPAHRCGWCALRRQEGQPPCVAVPVCRSSPGRVSCGTLYGKGPKLGVADTRCGVSARGLRPWTSSPRPTSTELQTGVLVLVSLDSRAAVAGLGSGDRSGESAALAGLVAAVAPDFLHRQFRFLGFDIQAGVQFLGGCPTTICFRGQST